jgi:hypothetical protein
MSDGPWATLEMSRAWRRVARFAEMEASSPDKVAQHLRRALADDFREIPTKVISSLRKAFGDGRQRVLGVNEHEKLLALRPVADGSPLGKLLISSASLVAHEGHQGHAALVEAMSRTLNERSMYGARQVEEHHYREAGGWGASASRGKIGAAAGRVDLVALAHQLLDINATSARFAAQIFSGTDEGPRL